MPKFSIITPVHLWNTDRVDQFMKTIQSVAEQTYKDFEWIVVDDGSTVEFRWDAIMELNIDVTLLHQEHNERVIAYNKAFAKARGDWFVLLDSDDEYAPKSLEIMASWVEKYPHEKIFNYGCSYIHKDGNITYRDPFKPRRLKTGHIRFGGGNIVNGTFIFNRSVYGDLGAYPPEYIKAVDTTEINYGGVRDLYMGSPYDFSAAAQLEFPEIREYFMVNHEAEPLKIIKELGNPWGQDYYLFYKYTRKYHIKTFKKYLYIVHPR